MPSFTEDIRRFRELLFVLWSVLDQSVGEAGDYFNRRGEKVDSYFFSPMVRYLTKVALTGMGFTVTLESEKENSPPGLAVLPNNGLEIKHQGFSFRLLKTPDGEMPVPGSSQRKQEFYSQLLLPLTWPDDPPEDTFPNRIVLWQVDHEYNLEQLYLAAPKAGDTTRASVEAYYNRPLPLPDDPQYYQDGQDISEADYIEDIDVTLREMPVEDGQDDSKVENELEVRGH